ncbi:MAG: hypothetical protein V2J89_04600 [Halieaceae bacterium]|jgi:hypothetical protein|nr:hypothetical protein [Halieaceae bacterium]
MQRRLLTAGTALVLVGLLMGFDLTLFDDAALALSAHVAALQHGMLLMLLGLAWQHARLGRFAALCGWSSLVGLVGIWLSILIDAMGGELDVLARFNGYLFLLAAWSVVLGFGLFLFGLLRGVGPGSQ